VSDIRKVGLLLAGLLVLPALFAAFAATASEAQPEVTDVKGDSASGKDSRDLTAAFFHTETNDSFKVSLNLTALESYTNPNDLTNAPTTEYQVYFSVAGDNYTVVCRVPVHGPFGFTIQYEIRSVEYKGTTTVETQMASLSGCTYSPNDHLISWLVQKTHFSNLTAGTHLTKTWAAVYNRNFGDSERRIEDRGPNSGFGKDYIIRGSSGADIIDVKLSVDNVTQPCKPNEAATFRISVFNNGTSQVSVHLANSTPDKNGWIVELALSNLTIPANYTRTVNLVVSCPRDAANGTSLTVTVSGSVTTPGNQTGQTNSLTLVATVNYIPPKPPETPWWRQLLDFFLKPTVLTYVVYVLMVLAIVGAAAQAAVSRARRKREEEPVPLSPSPLP